MHSPYVCDAKCVRSGMGISAFVHLCLEPTLFIYRWQLSGPGSHPVVSCWLLGPSSIRRAIAIIAYHGQSHQLQWCQAALSTVAGSHILNKRQLQHTALPLSPLILRHALGLRWPGWLHDCSHTQLEKRHTHIHDCSLRFTTIICR